ncbi:hypothetical protein KUH32_11800 [Thalassococcus sp. CAU 1522]|uniref:Uncharacterized protein n=1 Tax=Thalassococcus arenae TaxID=2851652 RepID=A0ABS6N8W6_9RHOB|nr:hypothetical protein [Thalassococcus arenae]MBV2360460.1 hypothetical protein [Thalassococcus arenae]
MATTSKTTENTETKDSAKAAREKRAMRLAKASNVAFSLPPKVRARLTQLAREDGLDLGHYLQKVLETHVVVSAPEGDELAERLSAKRAVIDQTIGFAQALDADGKFDEHFVLTVMKTASQDDAFMALYKTAVGDNRSAQKALNQQLGRLIRKTVGARGMRTDKGTVARAQVADEIISSYTLLTKQG